MDTLQTVWGWQPALYLFLGGVGAGSFTMAAVLYFRNRMADRTAIVASMAAAVVCLGVGLLLLLSDLVFPFRGLMMWQSFSNFSSWMTFGAWVLLAVIIAFFATAFLLWRDKSTVCSENEEARTEGAPHRFIDVLAGVGIAFGVCVALYTGILLMAAPGVPLWNTALLPCLFTVSALDTGAALVEIVLCLSAKRGSTPSQAHAFVNRAVIALVVSEIVVAVAFLADALSGGADAAAQTARLSAIALLSGELAWAFWALFVGIGLAVPLAAAVVQLAERRSSTRSAVIVGASSALVGGCTVRFLVLMAGMHADAVADSFMKFFY